MISFRKDYELTISKIEALCEDDSFLGVDAEGQVAITIVNEMRWSGCLSCSLRREATRELTTTKVLSTVLGFLDAEDDRRAVARAKAKARRKEDARSARVTNLGDALRAAMAS